MPESGERTLYVSLKARSVPLLNHLLAAVILIGAAIQSISHGHHIAWALVELAVALTLVVATVRHLHERRTKPPAEELHEHIGWVEILGGLFVGIEAYSRTRGPHHVSFVVLAFLPAFLLVALGVFESRLASRFAIRSSADTLAVRIARRARFEVPWADVTAVAPSDRDVRIALVDGSTRSVPTYSLWQAAYVRDWVLARAAEHVPSRPAESRPQTPDLAPASGVSSQA